MRFLCEPCHLSFLWCCFVCCRRLFRSSNHCNFLPVASSSSSVPISATAVLVPSRSRRQSHIPYRRWFWGSCSRDCTLLFSTIETSCFNRILLILLNCVTTAQQYSKSSAESCESRYPSNQFKTVHPREPHLRSVQELSMSAQCTIVPLSDGCMAAADQNPKKKPSMPCRGKAKVGICETSNENYDLCIKPTKPLGTEGGPCSFGNSNKLIR